MIELVAELDTATSLLRVALNRYLEACSAVKNYCAQETTITGTTLSARIVNELAILPSHKAKLEQAASVLGWVKSATTVPRINVLPPELLSRVFLFILGFFDPTKADGIQARKMPRYPDLLSHVCSHWRRIALDFPSLWTDIDLVYYHSTAPIYADRAKVFATRARHLPLNIHVHAPATLDYISGIDDLLEFLPMVAARAESLALTRSRDLEEIEPASGILTILLDILEPSTLRQLNLTDYCGDEPACIYASNRRHDAGPGYDCQRLNMSRERFESALLQVQVLRLDGLYPYWASQAYHGLTELYLARPTGRVFTISSAQLHSIFAASPELAVIYLGLPILDSDGAHGIEPAHLKDLEVLNTSILLGSAGLETLLGLITPGQKRLQLTMDIGEEVTLLRPNTAVIKFLKRSNVEKLCVMGSCASMFIADMLSLVPRLRILALHDFSREMLFGPFTSTGVRQPVAPLAVPKLDTLYFLHGCFDLECLCLMAKLCSPRTIVFWSTVVYPQLGPDFSSSEDDEFDEYPRPMPLDGHQIQEALSEFCPFVYYTDQRSSPVASWGHLG